MSFFPGALEQQHGNPKLKTLFTNSLPSKRNNFKWTCFSLRTWETETSYYQTKYVKTHISWVRFCLKFLVTICCGLNKFLTVYASYILYAVYAMHIRFMLLWNVCMEMFWIFCQPRTKDCSTLETICEYPIVACSTFTINPFVEEKNNVSKLYVTRKLSTLCRLYRNPGRIAELIKSDSFTNYSFSIV